MKELNVNPIAQNPARLWSLALVKKFVQFGINQFYFAPGLRNAPIIWALGILKKENNEKLHLIDGFDERSLAYRALGYSKAANKPSVLICTSGTAVSNFYPAVIEANKTKSPLIIISADRPNELTYINANQTIEQNRVFSNFAEFYELSCPSVETHPKHLVSQINIALLKNKSHNYVTHFNFPLREPVDQTTTDLNSEHLDWVSNLDTKSTNDYTITKSSNSIPNIEIDKNTLLIFGPGQYEIEKKVRERTQLTDTHVYVDISKGELRSLKNCLPSFDSFPMQSFFETYNIKKIIHFGGTIVSKIFYSQAEKLKGCEFFQVSSLETMTDWYFKSPEYINCNPSDFLQKNLIEKHSVGENIPNEIPVDSLEILASELALRDIDYLFIGNSSIIRSMDKHFFPSNLPTIYTNRGVSGIEGNIATAIGISDYTKRPLVLLLGDLSALHDLNSFLALSKHDYPIHTIVLNNNGGQIFRRLPIGNDKDVIEAITTPHQFEFSQIAKMSGLEYEKYTDPQLLCESLDLNSQTSKVYELNC